MAPDVHPPWSPRRRHGQHQFQFIPRDENFPGGKLSFGRYLGSFTPVVDVAGFLDLLLASSEGFHFRLVYSRNSPLNGSALWRSWLFPFRQPSLWGYISGFRRPTQEVHPGRRAVALNALFVFSVTASALGCCYGVLYYNFRDSVRFDHSFRYFGVDALAIIRVKYNSHLCAETKVLCLYISSLSESTNS